MQSYIIVTALRQFGRHILYPIFGQRKFQDTFKILVSVIKSPLNQRINIGFCIFAKIFYPHYNLLFF